MRYYALSFVVSLIYGGLAYAITTYFYMGLLVFLLFLLSFVIFLVPLAKSHQETKKKRHESYRFVNTFVIALSVTQSSEEAFLAATAGIEGEEKEVVQGIALLPIDEKIDYLSTYFLEAYYKMFVSVYSLYEEQGGDALTLAEPLLKEVTRSETNDNALEAIRNRNLVQFIILWAMSALVLFFVRVGLQSFYDQLAPSLPYQLTALGYFLIALLSFFLFALALVGGRKTIGRKKSHGKK
jgi:cytosine/uracil/thiamine/allantoin permease